MSKYTYYDGQLDRLDYDKQPSGYDEIRKTGEYQIATEVFCATGDGGGVDPSCSPGGKNVTAKKVKPCLAGNKFRRNCSCATCQDWRKSQTNKNMSRLDKLKAKMKQGKSVSQPEASAKVEKANTLVASYLDAQKIIGQELDDPRAYLENNGWELDDYTDGEIEIEAKVQFKKNNKAAYKQEESSYDDLRKVVKRMSKSDKKAFVDGLSEHAHIVLFDGAELEDFGLDDSYVK